MDSAPGKIALNCRNLIALVPGIIKARERYCAVTNGCLATARLVLRSAIRSCPQADFQPIVRLRDQARQSMFARCGEPDLEELVKPEPMSRGA